jgi:uroporphyrinogen-III decarboxylase
MYLTDESKRQVIRSAWLMEDTPVVPFMVEVGESHYARQEYLAEVAVDLAAQEAHVQLLAEVDDFALPSLKPNLGIGVVAAAFGCEWVPDARRDPWIKPVINDDNPDAVYALSLPDPAQSGMNALASARLAYFQDNGQRPLRLINVPSPLVTASLIWEYGSFLRGIHLYPRAVHALLDIVTTATIDFVRWQLQSLRKLFALTHEPWYQPPELGLRISDDTAAVLSPGTYRTFGVPYNARLAEAFGGIVVHSCGNIAHVLPAILETPGLRGIDLVATQNDWVKVKQCVHGQVGVSLRYFGWDFADATPPDLVEYSRALIECFGRRGVLLWTQVLTLAQAQRLCADLSRVVAA